MTSFKNLSIKQIVNYTTILVWLVQMAIMFSLWFFFHLDVRLSWLLLIAVGTFAIFYFTIFYILEHLIFRKIKLIYKFISDTKADPEKAKIKNIPTLSIDNVNEDVVDWAERKEKELEAMKLLETYRKNFVGNISHELKTPLFSIQGYLHTLLDGAIYEEGINIDYLRRAANNAERLGNIVDDLEQINKLEDESFVIEKSSFSVKELTKEVFGDLKKMAEKKKINLKYKDGAALQSVVLADKEAIRKVLSNLIVNAIKYGSENGEVVLSFYEVETKILIEVSDTGIGVEEKHLKHLFDRFYRVDGSRSRAEGGSGLGLSIVKHAIEAHGEKIFVRSTPNVGTTFGFTLPKDK